MGWSRGLLPTITGVGGPTRPGTRPSGLAASLARRGLRGTRSFWPALLGAALLTSPATLASAEGERGAALFEERCAMCHVAEALQGKGGRLVNDLREIDPAMFPVGILDDREVADLAAYLDSLPSTKRP